MIAVSIPLEAALSLPIAFANILCEKCLIALCTVKPPIHSCVNPTNVMFTMRWTCYCSLVFTMGCPIGMCVIYIVARESVLGRKWTKSILKLRWELQPMFHSDDKIRRNEKLGWIILTANITQQITISTEVCIQEIFYTFPFWVTLLGEHIKRNTQKKTPALRVYFVLISNVQRNSNHPVTDTKPHKQWTHWQYSIVQRLATLQ